MEEFLIWGWELVFPGYGGTLALSRGATLPAGWLHEPQPSSNQPDWWGWCFHTSTPREAVSPRVISVFVAELLAL